MPTATGITGQAYYGWLRRKDGSWQPAGRFSLNQQGYGRLILPGSDGTGVSGVEVTRQGEPGTVPAGTVVLRWGTVSSGAPQ